MFVVNGRFLTQKATGVHRYAFEICKQLYKMGVDFHVAAPKEINPDYKFDFNVVHSGKLKTHLWEQISLPAYLKRIGNPLLISFSGCGPLRYNNQIMTIHDISHERHPEWFNKNYCRYYGYMLPRIAKKAHAILTVSNFSKKEISEVFKIDSDKVHVVHCNAAFQSGLSESEIVAIRNKQTNGEKYILTVSSMDPRKNFVRLIEAFNNMEDKAIKLFIVGMQFKAFNSPALQGLVNDRIVLTGYISDDELKQMYQNALFSVYPSLYEGFGIPPLESMTYGCPVIASDIPALMEISGDAVLYANPYDITDLTEKMNHMAQDAELREKFTIKGIKQRKKYSWEKSALQVYELVQNFIN